jgi:hypothetical protein
VGVSLIDDVGRIAAVAADYALPGEEVAAVLPVELAVAERLYLCAFADLDGVRSWLALDDGGTPVTSRKRLRDVASIAALCEVAEETAAEPPEEPRIASISYLDSVGSTGDNGSVAGAIQGALPVVDELAKDIEGNYKLELT